MPTVYLSLGSNLGNRQAQLTTAITLLTERAGNIPVLSDFYETEPWGFQSQHPFLNIAVKLETEFSPFELLAITQQIERELGRNAKTSNSSYQDRLIDMDILLYDNMVLNTAELTLPHPLMQQRLFVLKPLAEIAPEIRHPILGRTIETLLNKLDEKQS
ncbi:MAG: 2-amino-4-hydroxy-6-hydroxymethyldihydropteridine diphosphokinase [Tannerella sp.]|jgi:2-amino-4-hydroxy-6-hydroxymethyldihydropteridine diphosphokinase|nr:2-amino-4-hydroxy-6-hydroxymethyldihydropteridine diphosphokinase [Tannerella sp.]